MPFIILLSGFFAAYLITRASIGYAERKGLVDHPGERSSHTVATPRGGGISIVAVTVIGGLILTFSGGVTWPLFYGLVLTALPVVAIGYLDDHSDVPPKIRLAVHLGAAFLVLYFLKGFPPLPMFGHELSFGLLGYPLGMLLLAWLLNLYNFMDGTDGIAAFEALFVSAAMMFFILICEPSTASAPPTLRSLFILNLLVCSGCLGFLLCNFPPARIFMGDVGSGFLGFFLGGVGLTAVSAGAVNIWTVLILFGVFLVDATFTLLRRIFRGDRWLEAHRTHAYQRYVLKMNDRIGRSAAHRRLLWWISEANLFLLFPFAWLSVIFPDQGFLIMVVALSPIVIVDWRMGAGLPTETPRQNN